MQFNSYNQDFDGTILIEDENDVYEALQILK